MKNSNDTIGNRTRDLPACSAVPQPTALPRAPNVRTWGTQNENSGTHQLEQTVSGPRFETEHSGLSR